MDDDRIAEALRHDLVDRLVARGACRSAAVESALRHVPRHRFVPDVDVHAAHEDRPQVLLVRDGEVRSTISQPTMIAIMLEHAALAAGDRVLEIGTGSGYNAALLDDLVGPDGRVVTVDREVDLVRRAARVLDEVSPRVRAIVADGFLGWPGGAPYDAIVVTASVQRLPEAWSDQLADGGRLLVPMEPARRMVVLDRRGADLVEVTSTPAAFVPLW